MMTYLSEDDSPGDWTMPEGLYRSGEFIFKNGTRSTWTNPSPPQRSIPETSTSESTSQTTTTPPNTTPNTSNSQQPNSPQQNTNPNQQNQAPQTGQP